MKCPKCQYNNPPDSKFCKECGTKLISSEEISVTETLETPKEELAPGTTFARRYQIIEEIGKGGMGRIYKAIDKKINETIALKLIKAEIVSDKKTVKRFSDELKIARKIVHKNVGRMYHLSDEKGTHYITMEYVSGEDLKNSLRRMGPLNTSRTLSIIKQVCEGLAEAHKLGIIHRDLKPGNIIIDKEGDARIMDFGIARSFEAKGITEAGVMIGTPEYMSPEQTEGEETDQRSDIYSLGVILYEMVTGRVPFEGKTPMSVASKHLTVRPREPRELNGQVSDELSEVIMKCMEKKREMRHQSVEELLWDLKEIEREVPSTERVIPERKPITSREITVMFNLKKLMIPAAVVAGAALIGVVLWQFILRTKAEKQFSPLAIPAKEDILVAAHKDWKNKDYSEALEQYRKVLALETENFEAQLSIAMILKEQGKIDKAIVEFEKVIGLNSADPRSYKNLGEIFEQKEESEKVVYYYRKYLSAAPESPDFDEISRKIKGLEGQLRPTEEKEMPIIRAEKTERQEREAEERKQERLRKQEIASRIKRAQNAYHNGDYKECLNQTKRVLRLDPANEDARKYSNLANQKIAPEQIKAIVNEYIQSLNNKNLLDFYKNKCSSELFQRIKRDAELISNSYNEFKSVASNISVKLKGGNKAEVSFSNITIGILRNESRKQVIFEGIYSWDLEKQGDSWKIVKWNAHPEKNELL